jgi:kynurenine formamidase
MFKTIDLTHTLSNESPGWDGNHLFNISITQDYNDFIAPNLLAGPPGRFRVQKIETIAGMGTHIDAPAHCIPGGKAIDELGLDTLITDCSVINVSEGIHEKFVVMPSHILHFEKEYGIIQPHSFVLFYTGWDKYWEVPEKYINGHRFPSVDISTAILLLERSIAGIGIDTLSCDTGEHGFPVHQAILGAGKYLVENIANAGLLPSIGIKIFILPMKIKDGAEAPVRVVGLI